MGGRGSSFGGGGGGIRKESELQFDDAKTAATIARAKYVEYTDFQGKEHYAENIGGNNWRTVSKKPESGVYRAKYDEDVTRYSKMSREQLTSELKRQQEKSNAGYWDFSRRAASQSGSGLKSMTEADVQVKKIKQVLRRKK